MHYVVKRGRDREAADRVDTAVGGVNWKSREERSSQVVGWG